MKNRLPHIQHLHPLLFLLPLFFVLHTWVEHAEVIDLKLAAGAFCYYAFISLLLFLLVYFFSRSRNKALFLSLLLQAVNFFGSAIREFFQHQPALRLLGKYSVILPAYLLLVVFCIWLLRRNRIRYRPLFRFVTLLVLAWLLADGYLFLKKMTASRVQPITIAGMQIPVGSGARNNIYLLLFDEYSSSASLKRHYGFNNGLDSFLDSRGYHVVKESRSNYNATRLSMASMLNMEYLDFIKPGVGVTQQDYNRAIARIKENKLWLLLRQAGYTAHNLSIFDLLDAPAAQETGFFPARMKLFTTRTLTGRIQKDIVPELHKIKALQVVTGSPTTRQIAATHNTLATLHKLVRSGKKEKQFIYAHFLMPHLPFFKDAAGNDRPYADIISDGEYGNTARYLDFVQYVNSEIVKIVNAIQQYDPGAVVLILGDHGYRLPVNEAVPMRHFENMNALYLPGRDYSGIAGSLTLINEFPLVLNRVFHTNIPLQKDSLIYIKDAQ